MYPLRNVPKIMAGIIGCMLCMEAYAQDLQADNMLLFQRSSGGWSKQFHGKAFSYEVKFSEKEKAEIAAEVKKDDANIDNESTKKEIRYLVKAFKQFNNPLYLAAAENGIRFLLKAQYENGGWPQYYPVQRSYRALITYNDNAMVNVLNLLQDVSLRKNDLEVVNAALVEPSTAAVKKGIDCILKTQIRVKGKLTGWCQQHDQLTFQPAKARAYELPSISGSESSAIVEFLMRQTNPDSAIKVAVHAAVEWLNAVKIVGYRIEEKAAPGTAKGKDRHLVNDPSSTIWARYYEIGTNRPFFCDRDGIVKYTIAEIGYERRNGYAWYGNWPAKILAKTYPAWSKEWGGKV